MAVRLADKHEVEQAIARIGIWCELDLRPDPKLTAAMYTHLDAEDLRGAVESLPALRVARE